MDERAIMSMLTRLISQVVTGPLAGRARRDVPRGVRSRVRQALRSDPEWARSRVAFYCYMDTDGEVLWGHAQREVSFSSIIRDIARRRLAPDESLVVHGIIEPPRREGGPLDISVRSRRVTLTSLRLQAAESDPPPGRRSGGRAETSDPERLQEFVRQMQRARPKSKSGQVAPAGGR